MSLPNSALRLEITIKTRTTVKMISSQGVARLPDAEELSSFMDLIKFSNPSRIVRRVGE